MKKSMFLMILLALLLAACGGSSSESGAENTTLTVGEKTYTVDDLKALPPTEAVFNDVTYVGVVLSDLLADAGVDASGLTAVKAIASDGYSMNYEPALFTRSDVILAYAQADGPLTDDDGTFRMVLPGEEGKLNVRQLVEIQAVP